MPQKSILYSVFLSLLLIVGIIFLWFPKYQEINTLKLEIKEKKIKLQNKEKYFQKLEDLAKRLEGFSSELAKINSALPPEPGVPNILSFLANTASQNGLILTEVNLEETLPETRGSEMKKTLFTLSLSGPYEGFKNFLSHLQKNSRLIFIEEISFQSPKEKEMFSFDLKIKTYSY